MPQINMDTLDKIFGYQLVKGDQQDRYERINAAAKAFAKVILECAPVSPEQTLAIRDVQRARMMANCAIATNE